MSATGACSHALKAPARPRFEVADIVRRHGASFRREHVLTPDQHQVLHAIERCRTASLGGHVELCLDCGHQRLSYNSCRNRHCPKCQALEQARWIARRMARLLPVNYFHVVFTLPAELRRITQRNRRLVFGILFKSAAQTLLELGLDPNRLGGRLGVTAVLHTWSRELWFHPHVHCIVTGGGLSLDSKRWLAARKPDYLLPVHVLGALFRGKMLDALKAAHRHGKLDVGGDEEGADPEAFTRTVSALYRKKWVVYAKRSFGGPEQVLRYLGRYTHRVGLSNSRIRCVTHDAVTFATKTGKTITLGPTTAMSRQAKSQQQSCGGCSTTSCPSASSRSAITDCWRQAMPPPHSRLRATCSSWRGPTRPQARSCSPMLLSSPGQRPTGKSFYTC